MVTTRSTKAVFSAPPSRSRRLSRSRRSRRPELSPLPLVPAPVPLPPPRRWGPGIRRSFSLAGSLGQGACFQRSQGQTALAGAVRDRGDAPVVAVATAVEHHGLDAGRTGALGEQLAHATGLGGLVAVQPAQVDLHRGRRCPRV